MRSRRPKPTWPRGLRRREDNNFDRQLIARSGSRALTSTLPLVHVTGVWRGKEIVQRGVLITNFCDVFSAELLYFFVFALLTAYPLATKHLIKYPASPSSLSCGRKR